MKISIIGRLVGGFAISAAFLLFIGSTLLFTLNQNESAVHQYEQVIIPGLDEVANLNINLLTANKVINQMAGSLNQDNFPVFHEEINGSIANFAASENFLREGLKEGTKQGSQLSGVLDQATTVAHEVFEHADHLFAMKTALLNAESNRSRQYDSFVGEWLFFEGDMGSLLSDLDSDQTRDQYWTLEYIIKQGNSASISINSLGSARNIEELDLIKKSLLDYVNNIGTKITLLNSQLPSVVADIQYYHDVLDHSVNNQEGLYFVTQEVFNGRVALSDSLIEIGSDVNAAQTLLEQLSSASREQANQLSEEVLSSSQSTKLMSVVILIASVVASLIIAFNLIKSIRSPLVDTVRILEQLASGDFTRRLTQLKQDEFGRIGGSVNRLADELSQVLQNILDSSVSVADFADASNQTSINTRQRTEDQKEKTDSAATAVTEMEAAIQEVASNAENTASEVIEVNDLAVSNKKNMDANIEQIKALNGNLVHAGTVVDTLNNDSNNIGSILEVIRGIAEQTNLLALNAAIEAARAGEHGRGFAVVADEVRNLANKTQQSTEEIDTMIGSLQDNAGQASSLMQQNQQLANQCAEQSAITGEALESMLKNLSQIRDMSASIATASEEQSAVAREVSQMIVAIASLAEDLSADAEMATEKSSELKTLAHELKKLVGNFTI